MPTRHLVLGILLFSTSYAASYTAQAAPTPPEATSCTACHGAQGEGMAAAGYPRLAGLSSSYLREQLLAYQDGRRNNAIMSGMAKPLSAAQIQTLADYFSGLPLPKITPAPLSDTNLNTLGQQLAERGDWATGIPACFNCHAPGGIGLPPAFPPLIGQPASYIEAQLQAWKAGTRQGSPNNLANDLMYAVAMRMNTQQIKGVAAWLAAQPFPAAASK